MGGRKSMLRTLFRVLRVCLEHSNFYKETSDEALLVSISNDERFAVNSVALVLFACLLPITAADSQMERQRNEYLK